MADSITAPVPRRIDWLQDVNSVLASAIFHLTALVVLGLVSASMHVNSMGDGLVVQLGDGYEAVNGEEGQLPGGTDVDEAAPAETPTPSEAIQELAFKPVTPSDFSTVSAELDPVAVDLSNALATSKNETFFPDAATAKSVDAALASAIGQGGHGKGNSGDGNDAATGRGSPWGKEDGFFGISEYGESIVYVVDCSDSMNENGKFRRLCYELMHALNTLSERQKYFIVFFNDGAYPMDADGPVEPSLDQINRTERWLSQITPGGGTNPLPALKFALTMQPDAIYFLSDGQFDPLVINMLKAQNSGSRKVPIHTISFVTRDAIGIMKMIAKNSGGKFRFVK